MLKISEIKVAGDAAPRDSSPLIMDEAKPRISWKLESDKNDTLQTAYRIVITGLSGESSWDSGEVISQSSQNICYEGSPLLPRREYEITVCAWNNHGEKASMIRRFETALLCGSLSAWESEGAKFIGAPEYYVCSETISVFGLDSEICLSNGGAAGIIFGADDYRLLNSELNEMRLEGDNHFLVLIENSDSPILKIIRKGYSKTAESETLAEFPLQKSEKYTLSLDVTGNCLTASVNGLRFERVILNPLGENDVTTFPHLGNVGYFSSAETRSRFDGIRARYLREPKNEFLNLDGADIHENTDSDTYIKINPDRHALPMLRREFKVKSHVKKARLYITARGIYEARINGRPVSDCYFAPGASHFDKHLYYQTYDVTNLLQCGENAVGITLASGWWNHSQTFVLGAFNLWGDRESVMAMLKITYADGSEDTVVTDESFEYYGEGAYKFAGFFHGERLDGGLLQEYEKFSTAGFSSDKLKAPAVIEPKIIPEYRAIERFRPFPELNRTEPFLTGKNSCPARAVEELSAKRAFSPADGVMIYDLGQEIAGTVKIRFSGDRGETAIIRYAEMLYPNLPEYEQAGLSGRLLTANLREAASTDKYILSGEKAGEIYSPKFTFHGFRYIEISGVKNFPQACDVIGVQLSSIGEISGIIKTDNPLLNRFIENVRYSQLCNFISIPTDCPQRNERMGWAGDAHVFLRTALMNADLKSFYQRYLEALKDGQEQSGNLPEISPVGGGFGGITYGSAMAFIVDGLYDFTEDTEIIREYYPAMKKYMQYLFDKGLPGDAYVGPVDDWLAPKPTDSHLIWNAFYGRDCALMAKFAGILGNGSDEKMYLCKLSEAKEYFGSTFFDSERGVTLGIDGSVCDTVGSYAIALGYDMLDETAVPAAQKRLMEKCREAGYTITTGFFATGLINPALSEISDEGKECAYKMMTETSFPSWLYPVTQGATTVWERWDGFTCENGFGGLNSMNSFNHYSFGCVLSWLYEYALGIKYRCGELVIKPDFKGFNHIRGGYETPYGRVSAGYERTEDGISFFCEIPANLRAKVVLKEWEYCVGSGKREWKLRS